MSTNRELVDAAVVHLKNTTTGYAQKNGQPRPAPWPEGTAHWATAMDLLASVQDVAPPVPLPDPDPPPNLEEPAPIAGLGYSLMFHEDFDAPIDTSLWRFGYGKTPESPANFVVKDSVLTITNKAAEKKQRDLQTKFGMKYGYFETRMRYTQDPSSWASLWMMSKSWLDTGDCSVNKVCEFDIFEAFQSISGSTWRSHSSTLHKNTTGPCGVPDEFRPNWTQDCGADLGWNWVVYGGLWTPTECSTYVNGRLCKKWPTFGTSDQPMYTMLGIWSHSYAKDVQAEFDWFRIWQK